MFNFLKSPKTKILRGCVNHGYDDNSIEINKTEPYVWLKCPPQNNMENVSSGRRASSSTASSVYISNPAGRDSSLQKAAAVPFATTKRLRPGSCSSVKSGCNACIGGKCACSSNIEYIHLQNEDKP